jgi:hypothetical protein
MLIKLSIKSMSSQIRLFRTAINLRSNLMVTSNFKSVMGNVAYSAK